MPMPIVIEAYTSCVMCDRDTIQFVMFTVWMFTFVTASRSSLYDSIAFLFYNILIYSDYAHSTTGAPDPLPVVIWADLKMLDPVHPTVKSKDAFPSLTHLISPQLTSLCDEYVCFLLSVCLLA